MNEFYLWFSTGLTHILDLSAYDHILFILAITAPYTFRDSEKLLWMITAFTIGHSVTLALSATNSIHTSTKIIEALIPVTILLSGINNLIVLQQKKDDKLNYFLTLLFGCVHGVAFSDTLKLLSGREENIIYPLFSFNLGIEIAQLTIVGAILTISLLLKPFIKEHYLWWNGIVSVMVSLIAIYLVIVRIKQF